MLVFVDSICVAGNRLGQNEDAWGLASSFAFVIDGATDVSEAIISDGASDAGWLSGFCARRFLQARDTSDSRKLIARTCRAAAKAWRTFPRARGAPPWARPVATMMMVQEVERTLVFTGLGDCRAFAAIGSRTHALGRGRKTEEAEGAQTFGARARPTLAFSDRRAIEHLRREREETVAARRVLGLSPACADVAVIDAIAVDDGGHVLLATDGFAALVDQYLRYTPEELVDAACRKGLAALAGELRGIEEADPAGARFPRWKTSDDATAVLLRVR